jgi:hypothetical protein
LMWDRHTGTGNVGQRGRRALDAQQAAFLASSHQFLTDSAALIPCHIRSSHSRALAMPHLTPCNLCMHRKKTIRPASSTQRFCFGRALLETREHPSKTLPCRCFATGKKTSDRECSGSTLVQWDGQPAGWHLLAHCPTQTLKLTQSLYRVSTSRHCYFNISSLAGGSNWTCLLGPSQPKNAGDPGSHPRCRRGKSGSVTRTDNPLPDFPLVEKNRRTMRHAIRCAPSVHSQCVGVQAVSLFDCCVLLCSSRASRSSASANSCLPAAPDRASAPGRLSCSAEL